MLLASALTAPFGLTELWFVPKYWNPPSLFDLAHRTGFDIESLIFCFAIGGLAAAGYRVLVPTSEHALAPQARNSYAHRWHRAALASPFFVFGVLLMLPWNPIYPGIAALFAGALASGLCRPDLWRNTFVGGLVFLAIYAVFLMGLKLVWPGYIEAVWNTVIWSLGGPQGCRSKNCFSALASACIGAAFTSTSLGGNATPCASESSLPLESTQDEWGLARQRGYACGRRQSG